MVNASDYSYIIIGIIVIGHFFPTNCIISTFLYGPKMVMTVESMQCDTEKMRRYENASCSMRKRAH